MKKQFFGESGLSATSANHIANLAKEAYEALEARVDSISCLKETITIIGSTGETVVNYATVDTINNLESILQEICGYKALIAWLREAIKEKENLFKENRSWTSPEYQEHMTKKPVGEPYLSREDIINSWTVKEQEEYLSLETVCAVIGKTIHPGQPLSRARKQLTAKMISPVSTSCSGRDTIITRYYPEVSEETVDNLFFKLQNTHRANQARLNGLKHKIDVALREDMQAKDEAYQKELKEHNQKTSELIVSDRLTREAKHKEIEALKIVIPNNLKPIFEKLNALKG